MELIGKLFEWLSQFWDNLKPFEVIDYYDRGVRLRLGKPILKDGHHQIMQPGLHWKIPFADSINTHMVKTSTLDLPNQMVTTKDGKSVLVGGILKYEVDNVAQLLLEVDGPKAAIADLSQGFLKAAIVDRNWDQCNDPTIENEVAIKIRREAKKFGISVISLMIRNLIIIRPNIIINEH